MPICFCSLDDEEVEDDQVMNETFQDDDEEIPNLILRDDGFYVSRFHVAR